MKNYMDGENTTMHIKKFKKKTKFSSDDEKIQQYPNMLKTIPFQSWMTHCLSCSNITWEQMRTLFIC